jgi:DNA-binding XRE family transcriptional regulator
MTPDDRRVPKYARVAAEVKSRIADGTLRPGQPAPSGAALSRVTGYSTLTCRRALRVLIADGVLLPGASRSARPRVAGLSRGPGGPPNVAAAARALAMGLAARRRALGLTQPGLAKLMRVSVTTVGHAETGRLWQSREFWANADASLEAAGDLLRLYEELGEASAANGEAPPDGGGPAGAAEAGEDAPWAADVGAGRRPGGGSPGADGGGAAGPADGGVPWALRGGGAAPAAEGGGYAVACDPARPCGCRPDGGRQEVPGAPGPACVLVMWADGTVSTVRRPAAELRATAGRRGSVR